MAFATTQAVERRFGRTLTDDEKATADQLLEFATALIAEAASKDDAWAAELDPIPIVLVGLCTSMVHRVMANPTQAASVREQLGAYSIAQNFRDVGMELAPTEEQIVRRVVHGRTSASSRPDSGFGESEELLRAGQGPPL